MTELEGVTLLWTTKWQDGPVEGMASCAGHDCWFKAIFDEALDDYPWPRKCRLLDLSDDEHATQRTRHRRWEEVAGGASCYHEGAPEPILKPTWQTFFDVYPADPDREVPTVHELGEFVAPTIRRRRPDTPDSSGAKSDERGGASPG